MKPFLLHHPFQVQEILHLQEKEDPQELELVPQQVQVLSQVESLVLVVPSLVELLERHLPSGKVYEDDRRSLTISGTHWGWQIITDKLSCRRREVQYRPL
jgi:hypothetical protein